jgi:hypothetical protein
MISALKVEGSVRFLDGVKNCTDSVHKFSRAFLLCYEFVQFLTPSKNLTDPSTFRQYPDQYRSFPYIRNSAKYTLLRIFLYYPSFYSIVAQTPFKKAVKLRKFLDESYMQLAK